MTETGTEQQSCLYHPRTERQEKEDTSLFAFYLTDTSANCIILHLCFMVGVSIQVFDNEEPGSQVPSNKALFMLPWQHCPPKIVLA